MPIRIKTTSASANLIGKSHWWGAPDLPQDVPYPCARVHDGGEEYMEPLTFVCQIRCRDIAMFDAEGLLPHQGMLYFFAPINYFLGETDTPIDHHERPVVIYSEQEEGLIPYEMHWEGTDESVFAPAEEIVFEQAVEQEGDGAMLLSAPYMDEIRSSFPDAIALLQIDEEDKWGLRFYDCGMYFVLMSREQLRAKEWGSAQGALFYY